MRKLVLALSMLLMATIVSYAQRSESEIALREYFIDAEFFLAQEYYLDALNDYLQVYKRGYKDNANVNYRIGICYLHIEGQKHKSIEYLQKALSSVSDKYKESTLKETNAPIDVYLFLGNAFRVNDRLDEAIESYKKYKTLLPEDEEDLLAYTNQQIEACNLAKEYMQQPTTMYLKNMGEDINASNDDFRPVLSADGKTMLFMRHLPFYDAVYYTTKSDEGWATPDNITPQIISDGDQYICDVSADGKTIYLAREDEYNSDIYISTLENNRWSRSEPLGSGINTKYWESHACISPDGKTLYFTSNRPGGKGEMDIYKVEKNDEGKFGKPMNVSGVNTELNEDTPFLTEDGTRLYFSTQGFNTMGGYDIFVSELTPENTWDTPVNLGYPVNTTDDDLFYFPSKNGEEALISRLTDDSYGGLDIYNIIFKEEITEAVAEVTDVPVVQEEEPVNEVEKAADVEAESESLVAKDETQEQIVENEAEVTPEIIVNTIEISPVLFDFDEYSITDQARVKVNKVLGVLKDYSELKITLIGFCDPIGTDGYNMTLSKKRAESVADYLTKNGIDRNRIHTIGKGRTNFIAVSILPDGSDNPKGRSYNRRVEFEFSGNDTNTLIIKRIDPVPSGLKIE